MDFLSLFFSGNILSPDNNDFGLSDSINDNSYGNIDVFNPDGSLDMHIEHNGFMGEDFITAPDGELIGRIQDGLDGSKMFFSPDGSLEFTARENLMGGYDLFDNTGQLIAQTLPNINPFNLF